MSAAPVSRDRVIITSALGGVLPVCTLHTPHPAVPPLTDELYLSWGQYNYNGRNAPTPQRKYGVHAAGDPAECTAAFIITLLFVLKRCED